MTTDISTTGITGNHGENKNRIKGIILHRVHKVTQRNLRRPIEEQPYPSWPFVFVVDKPFAVIPAEAGIQTTHPLLGIRLFSKSQMGILLLLLPEEKLVIFSRETSCQISPRCTCPLFLYPWLPNSGYDT